MFDVFNHIFINEEFLKGIYLFIYFFVGKDIEKNEINI